jgi:hypothetical protein
MTWLREFLSEWIAAHLIGQSDDAVPRTLLGWTSALRKPLRNQSGYAN